MHFCHFPPFLLLRLNYISFADDVVLTADSVREVNETLQELKARDQEVGLKINACKMKVMQSSAMLKVNLQVGGVHMRKVDSYVHLGQEKNLNHNLQA